MKTLVGAGVLMALMTAGAYSSDALAGFDMEAPGQVQPHGHGDKAAKKAAKSERKAAKQADRASRKADKADKPDQAVRTGKPEHPHGAPPGHQQRDRGGPPPWSGGPDKRTEEPPGLAKKDGQPKAKPEPKPEHEPKAKPAPKPQKEKPAQAARGAEKKKRG